MQTYAYIIYKYMTCVCVLRLETNRYLKGKLNIFGKERNKPFMHKFEIHFV